MCGVSVKKFAMWDWGNRISSMDGKTALMDVKAHQQIVKAFQSKGK
jgi:hypothetical protein